MIRRGALVVLLLLVSSVASAQELRDFEHYVRTGNSQLRALIRRGVDTSPSFRAMVETLQRTDVLVYVEEAQFAHPSFEAALKFVTTAGGRRYIKAEINWTLAPQRQLAAIAHELQHAIEIAQSPAIVSAETLAQVFPQIGWERDPHLGGRRFESNAAIDAGRRVYKEYMAGE